MIAEAATKRPAVLVVFDLLELAGQELRRDCCSSGGENYGRPPTRGVQVIEHVETHGEALFRAIVDGDHEGIVAKRADAPYRDGPQFVVGLDQEPSNFAAGGCEVARLT